MSWRTVVIRSRCKLDYKMGFMVVSAEETKRIFLDEIAVLLIENPAVALTGCLLDATNREGHAAKVYFNALFGMDFTKSAVLHDFNVLLLESVSFPPIANTKRYIIDEDLCEI